MKVLGLQEESLIILPDGPAFVERQELIGQSAKLAHPTMNWSEEAVQGMTHEKQLLCNYCFCVAKC